jgi:hypothetical protein
MAIRKANPNVPAGKTNGEAAPAAEQAKPENRYLRGMRVIAEDISVSADEIAKQADMSKSGAKACIIAWNTAVRLLDQKKALAISATDLVNNSLKAKAPPLAAGQVDQQLAEFGLEIVPDDNGWRIQKRA